MKALFFSAALIFGAAAYAQQPAPTPAPDEAVPPPAAAEPTMTAPAGTPPPGDGVTQQGTVPSGEAAAPPGTNEPPTTVPAGTTVPDPNAALAPQPATTTYPPCSRTITDRCIQTYERRKRG